jgi:trimeric autotransporter adhesin
VDAYVAAGQTSATTFYQSGQDAVILAAQIMSITDAPVSDLSISKVHNGTFGYGDQGTYTITVTNNGPNATSGTTTITDTLPAGETYVSATGTSWTCSAAGQVVTCTSTSVVANAATFNPITLTMTVATSAGTSLANTATVAVDPSDFDNNSGNNSSTDTVSNAGGTLVHPDLSTSTKSVFNPGGGDYNVGDTAQYTITLNESNGVDASAVSVTDNIPANLSGFVATSVTVSGSTTTITNSSTNTGGTNGDGLLSISNITVPANGSVTIVFTAQVKAGTANCATINNTGTITYAGGSPTTATVTAPTVVVAQSNCISSGNKILYVYDNLSLTRVVQTANTTGITGITGGGGTKTWVMTPTVPTGKSLVLTAGAVNVTLIIQNTGGNTNSRATTVALLNNGVTVATSGSTNTANNGTTTAINYTITIPATTVTAGHALSLVFTNNGAAGRTVTVFQKVAAITTTTSRVTFATTTVINVDSVNAYNAVYPATTTTTVYSPGTTVFICAVISDPFGSADATSAAITLVDSTGTTQVSAAAMTAKGATDCAGTANAADEAYEYTYTIPAPGTAATGFWTATVTGNEGTEGTITHTANGSFDVDVPALLIVKSVAVATDPVEGATRSKAIPGATVQYTIQIQNNGRGSVDSGTLVISDPVPTNTVLSLPAKPPFTFTDGATSSGLSVSANDGSIVYSNNGGTSYVYVPACTRPCTDSAITNFKITLNGAMNGKTGGTAPSFTITYNVVIQ